MLADDHTTVSILFSQLDWTKFSFCLKQRRTALAGEAAKNSLDAAAVQFLQLFVFMNVLHREQIPHKLKELMFQRNLQDSFYDWRLVGVGVFDAAFPGNSISNLLTRKINNSMIFRLLV